MKLNFAHKQKWILTASLLSILSISYQNPQTSLNSGSFELSSTSVEGKPENLRADAKSDDKKSKTQASTVEEGACTTGDCKTTADGTKMSPTDLISILADLKKQNEALIAENKKLKEAQKEKDEDKKPVAKKSDDKKEEDCDSLKSSTQRKLCETKKVRAEFNAQIKEIKELCGKDAKCSLSSLKDLMEENADNEAAQPMIKQAFNSLVLANMSSMLYSKYSANQNNFREIMETMSELPEEYSGLQISLMEKIQQQAHIESQKISQNLQTTLKMSTQDPNYQNLTQQVNNDRSLLTQNSQLYTGLLQDSLNTTGDSNALDYYRTSYLGNMQQIIQSSYLATATTDTTQQQQQQTSLTQQLSQRTGRQMQVDNQLQQVNGLQSVDFTNSQQKMTLPTRAQGQTQWNLPQTQQGTTISQPQTTTRGGRGSRVN